MSSATRSSCWQGADHIDPATQDLGVRHRNAAKGREDPRAALINLVNGSLP